MNYELLLENILARVGFEKVNVGEDEVREIVRITVEELGGYLVNGPPGDITVFVFLRRMFRAYEQR